jgi:hypothetical protein
LANLIGGVPGPGNAKLSKEKPAKEKPANTPVAETKPPGKLPPGKMGDKCKLTRPDGKPCPGRLTDLGGHFHDRTAKVTRTTLVCGKCNQVQALSEVADLD